MEYTPPPFFKMGPAPLVRLFFFASLSLALLVLDARFRYAETLRDGLALIVYPLQRAATAPMGLVARVAGHFSIQEQLLDENAALRAKTLAYSQNAQRYQAAAAEAAHLRALIGAAERLERRAVAAEILYTGRDPYSQKMLLDRGATHGIEPGSPVADEAGVVGQVTRVFPLISEVTLLTDKDLAIPVQVIRNGLRAVAFGGGVTGNLDLRYMAPNADVQNGDRLVTSGIDGVYPAGLPVATVVRIERDAAHTFARIVSEPAAGVHRGGYVLVLSSDSRHPPRPQAEPARREPRSEKGRRLRGKDGDASR
jgi:rod shape-determining protein MreC